MKHQNLQQRTKQFALQVIKFCEGLAKDETSKILARQLIRSGTSVGANYRAACLAKSKLTFVSKLGDVLEEADESGYWVELLVDAGKVRQEVANPLVDDSNIWIGRWKSPDHYGLERIMAFYALGTILTDYLLQHMIGA